ncbi:hypothetical protein [Brevundimonas sp.]|jgi:hypothetical protein|uniref:hypothetical protein n=1 Tax=Brevundimonas sp. TaxID=1871086 RepID=UPI0022BE9112|nr:hypothetical protein [Brevundimonas sp.]
MPTPTRRRLLAGIAAAGVVAPARSRAQDRFAAAADYSAAAGGVSLLVLERGRPARA